MVHTVVRTGAKLPDVFGDLDGEAVVEVAGEDEDFLAELVPFIDEHFAFVEKAGPGFLFVLGRNHSAGAAVRNHEGDGGGEEKEVGVTFLHRFEKPVALGFANHGNAFLSAVGDVVHVARAAGVEEEEFAIGHAEFSIGTTSDGIAHRVGDLGGHVELERVFVDHAGDVVDVGIFVSVVVVIFDVVDARVDRPPVHVEVAHLIEREFGEVGIAIHEEVAALFHFAATEVDFVRMLDGIGPAEVVVEATRSYVTEDGAAMAFAGFGGAPEVVDELVVVESEIAGNVTMPFVEFVPAIEIETIVFPDPDDGGRDIDDGREGIDALGETPGFGRMGAEFLVNPIAIHDVEVGFVSPALVEMFVGWRSVADPVHGVLIGAGSEFEAEVEEALGIVLGIDALFFGRKR